MGFHLSNIDNLNSELEAYNQRLSALEVDVNGQGPKATTTSTRAISCPDHLTPPSITSSSLSAEAVSSPGVVNQRNQRRLRKGIIPKDRGDFTVGRVLSWTAFAPRRNSPRKSMSKLGLCLGNSNFVEPKTQNTGSYMGRPGKILVDSKTKTPGARDNWKVYSRRSQKGVRKSGSGAEEVRPRRLDERP